MGRELDPKHQESCEHTQTQLAANPLRLATEQSPCAKSMHLCSAPGPEASPFRVLRRPEPPHGNRSWLWGGKCKMVIRVWEPLA